jgi:hypothetical protein
METRLAPIVLLTGNREAQEKSDNLVDLSQEKREAVAVRHHSAIALQSSSTA